MSEEETTTGQRTSHESIMAAIQGMGQKFQSALDGVASRVDQLAETVNGPPVEEAETSGTASRRRSGAEIPMGNSRGAAETEFSRGSRHWADRDDESMEGRDLPSWDSEDEETLEVSENTKALLTKAFSVTLRNTERRRLRNRFPTPDTAQTRCPKLDPIFKTPGSGVKGELKTQESDLCWTLLAL